LNVVSSNTLNIKQKLKTIEYGTFLEKNMSVAKNIHLTGEIFIDQLRKKIQ